MPKTSKMCILGVGTLLLTDARMGPCGCWQIAVREGAAMAEPNKKSRSRLHASLIEDYCMIGDCETAALVSREGSIDWLCWPTFSSGACFAALLGTKEHGYWKISPRGAIKSIRRQYRKHTLIVETSFETKDGEVCLVDFMMPRTEHSHVVRIVRGIRGKVPMEMDLAI